MATYRIGIGSFNLKDGAVGIGTESSGLGNLKVEGTIKTTDLDVGISTFTRYSGFEAEQTNIIRDASYGGNQPVTYTVTVIGGIFYIDGVSAPILTLKRGTTYIFDQSADTNSNHPFRFKDGDGNSYPNGVTATGTAGSLGAKVTLVVASNAPDDLRYYCTVHGNGMGNTISVINRTSSNLETTGDIVVETGKTLTVGSGATISVGSVECISVKHHFSVPVGNTAGRNKSSGYAEGTVRYNRDFGTMEFFNGNEWRQFRYQSDAQRSPSNRGRAVISSGGGSGVDKDYIEFFNIATQGNSQDFGVTTQGRNSQGSCSNEIRGVFGGGYSGGRVNTMDYITIASEGDATDFGDLTTSRNSNGGCSSSTRGLWCGGQVPSYGNVIEYAEIMTLGNAIDFGDLSITNVVGDSTASSPTRGIIGGGLTNPSSPVHTSQIDFVIISSKANSIKFGDLTTSNRNAAGASNSIRGVFGGGDASPNFINTIDYITMASEGNATDFGSLSTARTSGGGVANQTRATFCGGYVSSYPSVTNSIEFVQIASTGNATDFGDLAQPKSAMGRVSDSHGGLGGY